MIKHRARLWLTALLLGWIFDLLFWEKTPGISYPIFILLALGGGFFLAHSEEKRIARSSIPLAILAVFFALMSVFRLEPITRLVNYGYPLALMALLAASFLGGQWYRYNVGDYLVNLLKLAGRTIAQPFLFVFESKPAAPPVEAEPEQEAPLQPKHSNWKVALPILRGLVIAIPVVAILGGLLASADPIFSTRLENFYQLFRIENLGIYVFRGVYICILAFLLVGVYLNSLLFSHQERVSEGSKGLLPPFLGWIEGVMVLGSVNLLFIAFVIVQFQYFFGGNANIHIDGYTYAEYARNGFGELVAVALLSLILLLVMSSLSKRSEALHQRLFTGLGIALVALVIVILVSAYDRLILYEGAYGFSRVRTYTHVFIIWLGGLLLVTIVLEALQKLRSFALAAVIAILGFGITLNLMNVDGFITRQNINRAVSQHYSLDIPYLISLSTDTVPIQVNMLNNTALPEPLRHRIGAALACRAKLDLAEEDSASWASFTFSEALAQRAMQSVSDQIGQYKMTRVSTRDWRVQLPNGETENCIDYRYYPD